MKRWDGKADRDPDCFWEIVVNKKQNAVPLMRKLYPFASKGQRPVFVFLHVSALIFYINFLLLIINLISIPFQSCCFTVPSESSRSVDPRWSPDRYQSPPDRHWPFWYCLPYSRFRPDSRSRHYLPPVPAATSCTHQCHIPSHWSDTSYLYPVQQLLKSLFPRTRTWSSGSAATSSSSIQ